MSAQIRDPQKGHVYIVAEARMEAIPGAVPKQKKGKKGSEPAQKGFEVHFSGMSASLKVLAAQADNMRKVMAHQLQTSALHSVKAWTSCKSLTSSSGPRGGSCCRC